MTLVTSLLTGGCVCLCVVVRATHFSILRKSLSRAELLSLSFLAAADVSARCRRAESAVDPDGCQPVTTLFTSGMLSSALALRAAGSRPPLPSAGALGSWPSCSRGSRMGPSSSQLPCSSVTPERSFMLRARGQGDGLP